MSHSERFLDMPLESFWFSFIVEFVCKHVHMKSLQLGICMCRVFASHTCPVCSRHGRTIVRRENKMAKQLLVEVYKEVSEVHHR